jgi:hypothetical protein
MLGVAVTQRQQAAAATPRARRGLTVSDGESAISYG